MKRLLIAAIAVCFALPAFSQDGEFKTKSFSIGPSIGAGHAWLFPYHRAEFMPSWNAGIFAIYAPTEHWGVGVDVRYSAEGSKVRTLEDQLRVTHLNYIRIPIKGIYFFGGYADSFRPKVSLGPSVGLLVSQDDTFDATAHSADFGINASAGFNYRLYSATWLNFDVNYYQGLLDVRKNTGTTELNGNLGLSFGVAFGI